MSFNEKKLYILCIVICLVNLVNSEAEEFHDFSDTQNSTHQNLVQRMKYNYLYVDDDYEDSPSDEFTDDDDGNEQDYREDRDDSDDENVTQANTDEENKENETDVILPYEDDASDEMYESDLLYHTRTQFKNYIDLRKFEEPGIADENWPYPEAGYKDDYINYLENKTSRYTCPGCKCGVRMTAKISGGAVASRKKFPWMVMLEYYNRFLCGASLINNKYVLTAAHCLSGIPLKNLKCRFREFDRSIVTENPRQFTRRLARYWIHKKFSRTRLDFDVGLIKLRTAVNHYSLLRPICLPLARGPWGGNSREGFITGWGDKYSGPASVSSIKLNAVKVKIHTNARCKHVMGSVITKRQVCAGRSGREACPGDSGGPLVVTYKRPANRFKQIGIVSWGIGPRECGIKYGVYTRVTQFRNWIIRKASRNACFCNN